MKYVAIGAIAVAYLLLLGIGALRAFICARCPHKEGQYEILDDYRIMYCCKRCGTRTIPEWEE